jgi:hypothetical protein
MVRESLGLVGAGSQRTEFPDGILEQVVDVLPLIRRARVDPSGTVTRGLWSMLLRHTHAGAGQITETYDMYALDGVAIAPWTSYGMDVWLLGPISGSIDTSASLVGARLGLQYPATRQVGIDVAAAGTTVALAIATGTFDMAGFYNALEFNNGPLTIDGSWRMPIRTPLVFASQASGACEINLSLQLGVFPMGMGHDAR